MAVILARPGYFVKQRLLKRFQKCRQAGVRVRYLIMINVWNGRSAREIQKVLKVHNTTVYRVVKRFKERGEASLWDGREDNGREKLSEKCSDSFSRPLSSRPSQREASPRSLKRLTTRYTVVLWTFNTFWISRALRPF